MHLGQFHRTVNLLSLEFEEKQIANNFKAIITALNNIAASPSTEIENTYKVQLEKCRQILMTSRFNHPRPILKTIIESIGAQEFVGDRLFERIKFLISDSHMTSVAVKSVTQLQNQTLEFYSDIESIKGAFTNLKIELDDLNSEGASEIGLLIPRKDNESTLTDISKEFRQWDIALDPIRELFDPSAMTPQIRTCATTDWMLYLEATPLFLLGIGVCLKGINMILRETIEMRGLIGQLKEKKANLEVVKTLEKENESNIKSKIRILAEKLVDENIGDRGTRGTKGSELKNALSQSLQSIAIMITRGVKIELRILPPKDPEPTVDEETGDKIETALTPELAETKRISEELDQDVESFSFNDDDFKLLQPLLKLPELDSEGNPIVTDVVSKNDDSTDSNSNGEK